MGDTYNPREPELTVTADQPLTVTLPMKPESAERRFSIECKGPADAEIVSHDGEHVAELKPGQTATVQPRYTRIELWWVDAASTWRIRWESTEAIGELVKDLQVSSVDGVHAYLALCQVEQKLGVSLPADSWMWSEDDSYDAGGFWRWDGGPVGWRVVS